MFRKPVFRNPDKFQELSFRKWIRDNLPSGPEGFIAEDLDLVVRVFGARHGTDAVGKFRLLELKHGNSQPNHAQKRLYGLIDSLLRKADPKGERYVGYNVLNYSDDDWNKATFRLDGKPITIKQLIDLLLCRQVKA